MTVRASILVLFIIAAIAGPWAAHAAPASTTAPISTPASPPVSSDGTGGGNQDHVVGEDMC